MAKSAPKPAPKAAPKVAKQAAPAKATSAPSKSSPPAAKVAAKSASPAKTTKPAAAPAKVATPRNVTSVTKASAPAKKVSAAQAAPAPARKAPAAKPTPAAKAAPVEDAALVAAAAKKVVAVKKAPTPLEKVPAKPVFSKPGGDFDAKFLAEQLQQLLDERVKLVGQAEHLELEARQLMEDLDPGDVQFDDESGEGDSLVVERERDLALSAQARQMVSDIDAALIRLKNKTYGYSLVSGTPIPRERLQAIPWATELVAEKVGGLGSR